MIYFSQQQLLLVKTNEHRTTGRKDLYDLTDNYLSDYEPNEFRLVHNSNVFLLGAK